MLQTLKLLLPAIIPSWNFFDVIAPSPRIQFSLLDNENDEPSKWHEFRPRPLKISFTRMLGRMLWNPVWNESLFMVSCAERLMEQPTQHSEDEILNRIATDLRAGNSQARIAHYVQFRLLLVRREGSQIKQELVYESRVSPVSRV